MASGISEWASGPCRQVNFPISRIQLLLLSYRTGGTEAATFAALTTLKKQMDREQAVDVYQVRLD